MAPRLHSFPFTEEQVKKETQRCLNCGVTVVDTTMCVGCGMCTTRCKFEAIKLEKVFDKQGMIYEKVALKALPHIVKRKAKILATSVKEKWADKKVVVGNA